MNSVPRRRQTLTIHTLAIARESLIVECLCRRQQHRAHTLSVLSMLSVTSTVTNCCRP